MHNRATLIYTYKHTHSDTTGIDLLPVIVPEVHLPLCLFRLVLVVAAMLVLEGGELVVDLVSTVLLSVAIGSDELKEWVLSSWEA